MGRAGDGAARSLNPKAALSVLEELGGLLPVLPLPIEAALAYREICMRVEASQREPGDAALRDRDLWLAAHARAAGLDLLVEDRKRHRGVPGLRIAYLP